jgi:bifunctional DNase/RNase
MLELRVTSIERERETGAAVVLLASRAEGAAGPVLALTVCHREACALAHELRNKPTTRGQAFALLERGLGALGARLARVRLLPGFAGNVAARVELDAPSGPVEVPIEVGQALGLALVRGVPLVAAPELLERMGGGGARRAAPLAPPAETLGPALGPPPAILAAFVRAFAD